MGGVAVDWFAITPGRGDFAEIARVVPRLRSLGAARLLLREKQLDATVRLGLARQVARLCRDHAVALWISEDEAAAVAVGADGLQLSERSPSPRLVRARLPAALALGVSLHDPVTRARDEVERCAHAFLSPLFATESKPGVAGIGVDRFLELARSLPLPVYALGGVGEREASVLASRGIRRVAAIGRFFGPAASGSRA